MKNKLYSGIVPFAIAGFLLGLILNITSVFFYYFTGSNQSLFHPINYSLIDIIIILSPLYLSVFLGFIGFRKNKLVTLKRVGKIITQLNEAIIITDLNRAVLWVNEGFINIHGYTLKEIKGKNIADILHGPLSNNEVGINMLAKLLKGEAADGDLVIYHKNGEPIWISASIKPIVDKGGNTEGYVAINKNIIHRKAKELSIDALYKEIAGYKFALDQSSSVIIFDLDGKILKANNNFCIKNGLDKIKIVGRNVSSINTSMSDYTIATPIWDALQEGLTWKGELANRNADGKISYADATIVPLLDDDGKPNHFLSIERDITDRKLLKTQLEISKNKLEMAMKIAMLGSWEIDTNEVLTLSEEIRKIYQLPLQGLITITEIYKNIPIEDIEMINEKLQLTRLTFQNVNLEFRYIIDDEVHYMSSSNTAQFNQKGDFIGVFGTVQDITVSKLTELALKKSEEEKAVAMKIAMLGSWEINIDGVLILSNELRTLIQEPLETQIDLNYVFERMLPEEVIIMQNNLTSTSTTFQKNDMEFQYLVHGEIHYFTATNTAKFNKEGNFIGLFGIVQDVTSFKLIALALKKSEEEKQVF